jgi:signal transduction histidine kinase
LHKYIEMSTENLQYEQRITELEKKLQLMAYHLESCKKEKNEFIYLASHDLKAPLRKVATFVERLIPFTKSQQNEDAFSFIERIKKNVLRMQSLIDDLSAFCEIEAPPDFEKCDLNILMNEVLEGLAIKLKEKAATIHLSDLPALYCDPSQLKMVFKNIIDNAIKFQPKSEAAELTISSDLLNEHEKIKYHLPAEKSYYEIRFTDNGIGFNDEDAAQILKPFVRLNGQSAYPGNGLGLAACDKIIKLHNGIFYAKGIENKGSVFVLILPEFLQ